MHSAKYLTSPEWINDQKAAVLFAPFREKSLNPHSWETKMKFWTDAVLECAKIQQCVTLDLKTLTNYFERCGKCPKCLDVVVNEMHRAGKLKKLSDFQRQSNSWKNWSFETFVRRPVLWGFHKLAPSVTPPEEIFVIPEQVKRKAKDVLSHHYSQVQHETTDNILQLSTFRERCSQNVKSDTEFDVVLKQLELDQKVLVAPDKEGNLIIKTCRQSEEKVQPIQEIQLNVFRIQKVMKHLEEQIETLSEQSDCLTAEAQKLVREGKKTLALHQLRKRKAVQRQLVKKSSCCDTLHGIIHRIEDASSNEMVIKAYESGVSAIKQLSGDLTSEKVDKVLDDLQQVLEDQEEVSQAIADVSLAAGLDVSTDDLEMELNRLLSEESERKCDSITEPEDDTNINDIMSMMAACSFDDLPDVPNTTPGSRNPTPVKLKES